MSSLQVEPTTTTTPGMLTTSDPSPQRTISASAGAASSNKHKQEGVDAADTEVAQADYTHEVPPASKLSARIAGYRTIDPVSLRGRGTRARVADKKHIQNVRDDLGIMMSCQSVPRNPRSELKRKRTYSLPPFAISIEKDHISTMIMRAFSDSDDTNMEIKDCFLRVQVTELCRPVGYFWSAHDFVIGLRDVLKGHALLVEMGILHRGVSENNIVLGCHPNDVRGQIMDFDMATPYSHLERPTTETRTAYCEQLGDRPHPANNEVVATQTSPYRTFRTAPPPYTSLNVISGHHYTEYDGVESFFYVLILFFLSYKGPMDKCRFTQAKRGGFTLGPELPTHACNWPPPYKSWIRHSDLDTAISSKTAAFDHSSLPIYLLPLADALHEWSPDTLANRILHLITKCWKLFAGEYGSGSKGPLRVKHEAFIKELDQWLENTPLPKECNHCPFLDENGDPMI